MGILKLLEAVSKGVLKQADAAKKIAEMGYPESVAKRIASGELPMDEASRMARATEQGFNVNKRLLHGTDADIKAFDEAKRGSSTDARSARMATWLTDDPLTARSYANYAAMDSKVAKLLAEADKAANSGNWDKYDKLLAEAESLESSFNEPRKRLLGQNITPVYAPSDLAEVNMAGRSFDDYGTSDEIADRIAKESAKGRAGVQFNELDDAAGLAYQPATHVAVTDNSKIRSVNAAFDDKYKGSNILGSVSPVAAAPALGAMVLGSDDAEASPISFFAKSMKKIDDEIAKYEEIAEQYRGYLPNAETASPGEILREVNPQYSKYYQELKQMKSTAPLRSETENIRAVNDIIKNKRKDLPSVAIGTGALGGMSPEEKLFARNQPEMSAMPEGGIREALYSVGDVLKSRERDDITSTQELGDVFNKLGRGEKLGLMDYLESTALADATTYPAIIDALKEYFRKNGNN